jgi:APA family basic amino acid/polyamine antiporter
MRKIRIIREMGLFDCIMLGIGFLLGSGIFIIPLVAAETAGTYSLVAWVIGGIYAIFAGFTFAEAAAKVPRVGGLYSYAHKAYGNFAGFFTGWTFWIGYWLTISTEQWAIGWYLRFFLPQFSDLIRVTIGVLTGLFLTYINFRGVEAGARVEDIFTVGKLAAIVVFVIGLIIFFRVTNLYPLAPSGMTNLFPAIGSATILVLWAFLGVEIITVPDGEIKNAKKVVPKAIIISILSVTVIYLLVSTTFLGAARWTSYVSSQSPLADLFRDVTGSEIGGIIISIGGLIAIIGSLNAVILGAARIAYSMSKDDLLPQIFSKIHPKYETPYMAILIQTILALILTYTVKDFVSLASLAVFFTIVPYTISSFATLRLIKKANGELTVLSSRLIPIISGIASLALLAAYWNNHFILEIAGVMLLVGLCVYIERKKIHKL